MAEKKVRKTPEIFRNIISPSSNMPLLEFYKGYYECIYLILHPFYKVVKNKNEAFSKKEWPGKEKITKLTKSVSWAEVIELSGLPNIKTVDIALRNSTYSLAKKHQNENQSKMLNDTCQRYNLLEPNHGDFSELLIDDMLKPLLELGHEWVFIGDEFGHERKLQYINDIIRNKVDVNYHHENWYTPQNEILYTTHWDSHFTLLCSDRETTKKILEIRPFEGFYCDADTGVYWSLT
ncbi:DUF2711 family protein [Mucilaginibacter gilvus]|uniref:DUF2711 family protein n=1 Tax=Mucilaginibacter gilvus TaxID=2305909 RepID=A0A3S4Y7Y0_9SPHI|nr:DUF2711 family protein [Mucilaginibacter gilvus]RWY49343.1 DUF2711 family protein [Mucilaginibacter gilvus]